MDIQNVNFGEVDFLLFHFCFLGWKFMKLDLSEMKRKCALSPLVTFAIVVMIKLTGLKELFLPHVITLEPAQA